MLVPFRLILMAPGASAWLPFHTWCVTAGT